MRVTFNGTHDTEAFFTVGHQGVLVHLRTHRVRLVDEGLTAAGAAWYPLPPGTSMAPLQELAAHAVVAAPPRTTQPGVTRRHSVPRAVQEEAAAALLATRHQRVPAMTRFTARCLASGTQLSYAKVQHIARYLREGGDTTDVLRGLWGGEAAERWINGMIAKRTLLASAAEFIVSPEDLSLWDDPSFIMFALTQAGDPFAVEALLSLDINNDSVQVWDAGSWVPFDEPDLDALANRLVEVDQDTALDIAASFDEWPGQVVHLATLQPDETALAILASFDETAADFRLTSHVTAALAFAAEYTPEERAQNAGEQPRDANGRFATIGAHGTMKSGEAGTIRGVNPMNNYLLVESDAGKVYSIPSRDFEIKDVTADAPVPAQPPQPGAPAAPIPAPPPPKLDLSKILAQPRAVRNSTKAVLDHALPPLGPAQLRQVLDDYNAFIRRERQRNARKFALGDEATALTPETSDVKPLYLAVVDRDDPLAVLDLVALSPATSTGSDATTYRRVSGQWIRDDKVLQDLKGPTPPPVVTLTDADLQGVLAQVDNSDPEGEADSAAPAPVTAAAREIFIGVGGELWAFTAAGDGNVGAAERLRQYWTTGKGGLKIRWGTGGDWTRCHRHLQKYLGTRSEGYCATLHHRMTGIWPGDHRNK